MYYLVDDNSSKIIYTKYYINRVSHDDFTDSFKMYITDNIHEDFAKFDNRKIDDPNGVVILPEDKPYFIALISDKSDEATYFHELTHLYDAYLFKKYFNLKTNGEIRTHKYFKTFSIWTEYHAKYIELKYTKLFYKHLTKNNANDFIYLQNAINQEQIDAWQNIINQYNCLSFHNVMYLFALINFAKKHNPNTFLNAEENTSIPLDYYNLLPLLEQIEDFSDFLIHIDELEALVAPLPLN